MTTTSLPPEVLPPDMPSGAGRRALLDSDPPSLRDEAGTLPLELYAALGDGRGVAVVGADCSVDWFGVPGMDSAPLFDRLLDPKHGGRFSITPEHPFAVERRYLPDSNVLEQVFTTRTGRVRVTDSLNSGISGRLPWCELARRVEGLAGEVALMVEMHPGRRLEGASPWREETAQGDVLHIDGVIAALRHDGELEMLVRDDYRTLARLVVQAGSRTVVAVLASSGEPLILPTLAVIDRRIDRSDQSWREWSNGLSIASSYAAAVRRSALVLKLLLFSPTGAIAAAATTSLPERIGGAKTYDYRYAWVRDVAFTIKAFLRVGATEEAKAAFSWLTATITRHDGDLRTMYALDGSLAPAETELDLPGYAGSRPVRAGNQARDQLQLSIYGDVLQTAALFVEDGHILDLVTRRLLAELADRCADLWRKKDSGLWELPEEEHYTMSKIGCWTALNRAVQLAEAGQIQSNQSARWQRERDRIRDWIDAECWCEAKQSYTLHAGTDRLDAALMLAIPFAFERRDRLASTRDAVHRELVDPRDPHGACLYRYTGMAEEEGTFIACGFWLAEAYALLGDRARAVAQMDGMLRACDGNLGLYTEMIEGGSRRMLGNLPQALSHLALILAADAIGMLDAHTLGKGAERG